MTKTRGRKPGFRMSDEHRTKIKNSQILKCLLEHVEGKREMSATQVTAGLGLLKKVLPDLSAVELKATVEDKRAIAEFTDAELAEYIHTGSREGTTQETAGPSESDPVH